MDVMCKFIVKTESVFDAKRVSCIPKMSVKSVRTSLR